VLFSTQAVLPSGVIAIASDGPFSLIGFPALSVAVLTGIR